MKTRLYSAIAAKNVDSIRESLNSGADINEDIVDGLTPLLICVQRRYEELLPVFLEFGANLELTNKYGQTPLHVAARNQSAEILKVILPYCTKKVMNLKCNKNKTALMYLMQNPRADTELVNLFVKQGAEVNAGAGSRYSAIHCFIESKMKKFDVLEALLQNGADPDIIDERGWTSLHLIVFNSYKSDFKKVAANIMKILLKYKADMHRKSRIHQSPFLYVACRKKISYIKIFIDFGVNVNECNFNGDTALHRAVSCGRVDSIELLLLHDADINIKNRDGRSPFQYSDWLCQPYNTRLFTRLWEHIFILRLSNQFVVRENIEVFERRNDLREENERRCLAEIERLKEEIIHDKLTLYHVAVKNNEWCFRNQTILEKFKTRKDLKIIRKKYPIFSTTIRRNIERIYVINEIDAAINNYESFFVYLPLNCRDVIWKYLILTDLKFFLQAFSSDPSIIPSMNFKY